VICPLALGTQTIGSVIRPAAYCGIVGVKPTYGRIPIDGIVIEACHYQLCEAELAVVHCDWFRKSALLKILGACLVIGAVIVLAKSEYRTAQAQIR